MSSIFANQSDGQQQSVPGGPPHHQGQQQQPLSSNAPHHQYDQNQYGQHMHQNQMQPGYNMRSPAMHPNMPAPIQHNQPQPSHQLHHQQQQQQQQQQMPHQLPPQAQPTQMSNQLNSVNPGSMNQPQTPSQMAPPASVQKLLDENNQFIQLLLDYQAKGKQQECMDYQRLLHRNLVYLATVADASNQSAQNTGVAPNIPLPPNATTPNVNGHP